MEEVEMESENNRHWSEITSNEYLFTRLDMEAEMIGRLTKQEVLDFYNKIMLNSPKLSIQVIGNKESEIDDQHHGDNQIMQLKTLKITRENGESVIENITQFRNSLGLYEPSKTIVDL